MSVVVYYKYSYASKIFTRRIPQNAPEKNSGDGGHFFNTKGEILIVKPDYREGWLLPGGTADEGESPRACGIRETKEELGLDISDIQLVGVYHSGNPDSLKFIYNGGILTDEKISQIHLQEDELEQYAFLSPTEALPMLSVSLQKSLPASLEAIKNNTVAYVDNQN